MDHGSRALGRGTGSMAKTAKATRSPRGSAAAVQALPLELILWEILLRLPPEDVLRCRAVCRAWRRATYDADFLLAHHRRQPSLPLVCLRGDISLDGNDGVDAALDAFDLGQRPTERQPVLRFNDYSHRRRFTVHACCDGLILLSLSNGRYYLCNPTTRQWMSLAKLNGRSVAGMYLHSPSGEYRILYWTGAKSWWTAVDAVYYVLTVGSLAEPRCIGQPIASPLVQSLVGGGLWSFEAQPPVLLHNSLHWIKLPARDMQAIVVFDTVGESFRLMRYPVDESHPRPRLLEMDGTLGISWQSKTAVELCVLEDYETEAWSVKHHIDFPVAEMSTDMVENSILEGMIVSKDGDALIYCFGSSKLLHLDSKGMLLQKFEWDGMSPRATEFRFKQSIIRHSFFERPKQRGRPVVPRFFRGL